MYVNCCECALKIILSTIMSALLIVVVIGLIIYFAVYYKKDEVPPETHAQAKNLIDQLPKAMDKFLKALQ
uniref:Protein midgut expression 1 n=1 Tax=Glossina palpalis gambiensis TaxID=67801 RepID=A0A1B0AWC3_9MUSC